LVIKAPFLLHVVTKATVNNHTVCPEEKEDSNNINLNDKEDNFVGVIATKAVNREVKLSRRYRDRDLAKFESSRRYRER
jgi:hypothetical protein